MHGNDNWIQTFTGRQFWPLDPAPEDVHIEDIAHALSLKCRYGGHTKDFYSVAQHSVMVSWVVTLDLDGKHMDVLRWALMHDAAEAYSPFGDVPRPVKKQLPWIDQIETTLDKAIARRFGLPWDASLDQPPEGISRSVKQADLVLLATERRDLMATPAIPWKGTCDVTPLANTITPLSPEQAEALFLQRFRSLFDYHR